MREALRRWRARPQGSAGPDSWKSADVARQMLELAARELAAPDAVAPFAAFRQVVERLAAARPAGAAPLRLVDVGCGVGGYADLLERWAPGRFAYTGLDHSEPILAAARARRPDLEFRLFDALEEPLPDGFDVVLASALLDVSPDLGLLDRLLACSAPVVVLHRQRIVRGGEARIDEAPGYAGQTTWRTEVPLGLVEAAAARHGRSIAQTVQVARGVSTFVLERAGAA
jgi:SAM-dependent methyltransferase